MNSSGSSSLRLNAQSFIGYARSVMWSDWYHIKDCAWQETVVHHPVGVGDAQNRDNYSYTCVYM